MSSGAGDRKATYLLRCNGGSGGGGKRAARRGEARALATYGGAANVTLKIADIARRLVCNVPDVVTDLLEVAALVYAADQWCVRTPGRRFDYGRRWHRDLRFDVAVRAPAFWGRAEVRDALAETLGFLSEDDY